MDKKRKNVNEIFLGMEQHRTAHIILFHVSVYFEEVFGWPVDAATFTPIKTGFYCRQRYT